MSSKKAAIDRIAQPEGSWSTTQPRGRAQIRKVYGAFNLDVSGRIILDLCGGTGAWSEPYRQAGYQVRLIDPVAGTGDVRVYSLPRERVYGILAAPPCTVFSMARTKPVSESELVDAMSVVDACLRIIYAARPAWWALENPRGRLIQYLGRPTLSFQPWEYGDPWTKRTHVWGSFTAPAKYPVQVQITRWIEKQKGGRTARARARAITPSGFARAFFEANP